MFEHLWNPLIPHLTVIGFTLDVAGVLIIVLENFCPKYSIKIDHWLSQISYMGFTSRLESPLFFTYDAFYKYLFIPAFIFFVIASFYDIENVKKIIDNKWDFFIVLLTFLSYFMGYMLVALVFIWWILPILFIFSSKVMYKNKPLTGCGFMLVIIGMALTLPQILQTNPMQ